ncbi:MAG: lysoplasmalogenase [Oscillospiraceae bacterium]|nr:lysoplasmalogenase [Oscillospiraceae bacterium]
MLLKILLLASVALSFLFVPWFLKAVRPGRSRKSLLLKTVCSTLFLVSAALASGIAGNRSLFATLILWGLALGWAGDFLLHVSQKQLCLLAGLLSFLGGHVFYIAAYSKAIATVAPGASFFDPAETAAFLVLFAAVLVFALARRKQFAKAFVPVVLYAAMLLLMFVKASSLGMRLAMSNTQNGGLVCLILLLGVMLFVVSDALLAVKVFFGKEDSHKLMTLNIITYYAAQQLLACTILFVY